MLTFFYRQIIYWSRDWHEIMWIQSEFKSAFKQRYQELRKGNLSDAAIEKIIDNLLNHLKMWLIGILKRIRWENAIWVHPNRR